MWEQGVLETEEKNKILLTLFKRFAEAKVAVRATRLQVDSRIIPNGKGAVMVFCINLTVRYF